MTIGKTAVGKTAVGEMTVGETSSIQIDMVSYLIGFMPLLGFNFHIKKNLFFEKIIFLIFFKEL